MELYTRLEQVNDRASFFEFVQALIDDRRDAVEQEKLAPGSPYSADTGAWEHTTIEHYLDAALAWAKTTNMGIAQGLSEEPTWQAFAVFLYVGKIYE
ncbi:MAG: hypothetical protein KME27_07825 [Lyngbya sp. HA4199-MV5]|jgi:predicted Ser/Thr protein kinase|nr:hypothetical protein [Lyngbya sp. HA4199-MV5]